MYGWSHLLTWHSGLWWDTLGYTVRVHSSLCWADHRCQHHQDTPLGRRHATGHCNEPIKTNNFSRLLLAWRHSHTEDAPDQIGIVHQSSLCEKNQCNSVHRIVQLHRRHLKYQSIQERISELFHWFTHHELHHWDHKSPSDLEHHYSDHQSGKNTSPQLRPPRRRCAHRRLEWWRGMRISDHKVPQQPCQHIASYLNQWNFNLSE